MTTNTTAASWMGLPTVPFLCVLSFDLALICGGNALVIIIFIRTQALRVASCASIINLAVADFCIGLDTIFLIALQVKPELLESYNACLARVGYVICIYFVSIATLTGKKNK